MKRKTDWNLLAKDLAGETNEQEKRVMIDWLNHRPENRELYEKTKSDWKMMENMNKQFNVDNAWIKVHNRIKAGQSEPQIADTRRRLIPGRFILTPVRIAAAILLLALLGTSAAYILSRTQRITVTAAASERGKHVILPDGSSVVLNGNSTIRYTKQFGRNIRKVQLAGEAFFEVAPDKSRPFRIFAGDACISVLGTSFNVDARAADHGVEVYVSEGIVELSDADHGSNRIILRAGTIGLFDNDGMSSRTAENQNIIAWKTGFMTFYETRLSEVTPVLNDFYNVQIVIREPAVDSTRITGEYNNDPLDEILEVICKQNHLAIEKSENMIYLSRQ